MQPRRSTRLRLAHRLGGSSRGKIRQIYERRSEDDYQEIGVTHEEDSKHSGVAVDVALAQHWQPPNASVDK